MMHSHVLARLSCILLSLLSLARALPSPQNPSEPSNVTSVVPLSPGSPLAGAAPITFTDLSGNALNGNASDDVVDGVDLTNFVFNPLQMPTVTGPSESETVKAFQPLTLPSGPTPSVAVDSALTSRSISSFITIKAKIGSFVTRNNKTAYSFAVNKTAMTEMLADATVYGLAQYNSGNLRGNESDQNYYRFTSRNLTIAAIVYGEAGTGDEPFNWGDFTLITGFLTNLTVKHPNNNLTWNGGVTMEDGSRGVDFFIVPSFGDILDSSPPPPATPTPPNHPGGADGGLRLAKRIPSVNLGVDGVRMTIRKATTRIMSSMLYYLATTALDTLLADSGQEHSYRVFIQRSNEEIMQRYYPNQIMHIVATDQGLSRDVILAALQALMQFTLEGSMNTGNSRTLYGELIMSGTTIARWSLGTRVEGAPPCVVQNPDGSMALGCILWNY